MANIYAKLLSRISGTGRVSQRRTSDGPRGLVPFADSYIVEHFGRLGYAVVYDQLVFTTEPVSDFVEAREKIWHRPGTVALLDISGLLIVEDAQPQATQPTRDLAVVSLGDARVVMGVLDRKGRQRFAATM